MLEKAFNDVYTKFKLHFYQNVFQRFATREATLTTVESFCMEGIMAMGEPTIAEFSRMMQISTPNAAYKIGSLVLLVVAIVLELAVLSVIRARTRAKTSGDAA